MATVGTPFRDILRAMKVKLVARVANGEIFPAADSGVVKVSNRMNPPAEDGKKSLVLVPLYQAYVKETTDGHGRCGTHKRARVNIYYRHESLLDQTYQDDEWLLADDGYFQILEKVEDTFDQWNPQDVQGRLLLVEPMRALMDNEPRKNYDDHTRGDGMVEIEVVYQAYRTVDTNQDLRAAP